jgi:curli biogenesis system outer membrane secretion channel CsgG
MNRQVEMGQGRRIVGLTVLLLVITVVLSSFAAAQQTPIMVGISPLTSKVADIPAEEAQELFINALMETNHFSIRPPDANGSYAGVTYVLEPTISEAKAKGNVLGFLKDAVTSKPINLTIRVFDPRTNALLKSVTVKSTETNNAQVSLGDVQSLMGALGAGKGEQSGEGEEPDKTAQLEERLGGLMQQAATRLVNQLGGGATGAQRPGTAQRR